ncbi:MAG: hypothetical protein R3C03_13205 [Pirellulaceae bacterium]
MIEFPVRYARFVIRQIAAIAGRDFAGCTNIAEDAEIVDRSLALARVKAAFDAVLFLSDNQHAAGRHRITDLMSSKRLGQNSIDVDVGRAGIGPGS